MSHHILDCVNVQHFAREQDSMDLDRETSATASPIALGARNCSHLSQDLDVVSSLLKLECFS